MTVINRLQVAVETGCPAQLAAAERELVEAGEHDAAALIARQVPEGVTHAARNALQVIEVER